MNRKENEKLHALLKETWVFVRKVDMKPFYSGAVNCKQLQDKEGLYHDVRKVYLRTMEHTGEHSVSPEELQTEYWPIKRGILSRTYGKWRANRKFVLKSIIFLGATFVAAVIHKIVSVWL